MYAVVQLPLFDIGLITNGVDVFFSRKIANNVDFRANLIKSKKKRVMCIERGGKCV